VVAGDQDDVGARIPQPDQGVEHDLVGFRRHRSMLVEVSGDEDRVHRGVPGHLDHLVDGGDRLVVPRPAPEPLPHVPIAGVQELHVPGLRFRTSPK
jgi:hypothetical protein